MKEILPLLFILVCPIMMIVMMRGVHGAGHNHSTASGRQDISAAELRRLRDEIDVRLQALDERLQDVEAASSRAAYDDAIRA